MKKECAICLGPSSIERGALLEFPRSLKELEVKGTVAHMSCLTYEQKAQGLGRHWWVQETHEWPEDEEGRRLKLFWEMGGREV